MTAQIFIIYLFLSQFPAIISIGSSYIGLQILLLPLFYYFSYQLRKLTNYILIILGISVFIGFLKFGELNLLELNLRIVSILTVTTSLLIPIVIYKRFDDFALFKDKFLKILLLTSFPTLLFCFLEVIYKVFKFKPIMNILLVLKNNIFVPYRNQQTVGTLSGFFPEHGLFACYLLFIIGISFLFIDFKIKTKIQLLSISWILLSLFHSSGLFLAALGITIFIFIILNIFSLIRGLKFSKKIIKFSFFGIIISGLLFLLAPFLNIFLFERFSLIFANFDKIGFAIDSSLNFKLLPYYILLKSSILELFTGSGSSYYSNHIATKIDLLPSHLVQTRLFNGSLARNRFALNSTIICIFIEYGSFLLIAVLAVIKRYCILFKPINLFVNFSKILKLNFEPKQIFSIFFLFSSFITLLGAVPLTYPFPYLSLSVIYIIFDNQLKLNAKDRYE